MAMRRRYAAWIDGANFWVSRDTLRAVQYVEIAFTAPAEEAEEWAAELYEWGVEIRDAETLEKPPAGTVLLVVWVPPDAAEEVMARVGLPARTRTRDEAEWRELWKQYFKPRRVGRFVIVPSWESYEGPELRLELDPGRAFGTGQHASTRLCLEMLDGEVASFLDVGCGSGVLAIACKKLWPAARGMAMDIDPDAVEVSRENAARNRVEIDFSTRLPDGEFDLVLANIQPEVLIPLAPRLMAGAKKLILSGILVEAAEEVVRAYSGMRLVKTKDDEGWRVLVLEK
jgi:ribosomal protein L11 methyltransferase